MKRRELLQASVALGAYMVLTPLHSFSRILKGDDLPTKGLSIKNVGLLLAASQNATWGEELKEGLAQSTGSAYQYHSETITKGIPQHYRSMQKLIHDDNVDILISMSGPRERYFYTPIYTEKQTPFLEVNLGENINLAETSLGSMNLRAWQSNYAAGMYAAKSVGKRAIMITSVYDVGYDCYAAFLKGYSDNGGDIVEQAVIGAAKALPNLPDAQLDSDFAKACASAKADCVLLHLSGSNTAQALNFLRSNNLKMPVVASYQSLRGLQTTPAAQSGELITALPNTLVESSDDFIKGALQNTRYFAILGYLAGEFLMQKNNTDKKTPTTTALEEYSSCRVSYGSSAKSLSIGTALHSSLHFDSQSVITALSKSRSSSGYLSPYLP